MAEPPAPRLFALPPGADFPAGLVAGLCARLEGAPPEAMADVTIYLNTARMRRRVTELFAARGAGFLPRLILVTELADDPLLGAPPAIAPLRRRLELAKLVAALLESQPDLAPRAALYDLADSLAGLMDEMQGEGVAAAAIAALDVSGHSRHWERTQTFLNIIAPLVAQPGDPQARQRLAVARLASRWQSAPPQTPVLMAGSTGSRGSTALFMQAVAGLPQGAVVLPGFDFDLPAPVWAALDDAMTAEDHPQYRFRRLLDHFGIAASAVQPWHHTPPPDPQRNRLISLSLRPAPVTDQWLAEGQDLSGLDAATAGLSLIEAPSPRIEALAIALALRKAAEDGVKAALITPDRNLSRQVTAALDRWGIEPDDSAGSPLAHSAPGRFLRQIAALFGERLAADQLLGLLKHPLTNSGGDRGAHLRLTRELELRMRAQGPAFPTRATLLEWAEKRTDAAALPWMAVFATHLPDLAEIGTRPLPDHVAQHLALAETLARGTATEGSGGLWEKAAGAEALRLMQSLANEAPHGGTFTAAAYRALFDALIARGEVRDAVRPHPQIMIWGTLEARVQGADLVILGGLNDGVWPKLPGPDPWLNRMMRKAAGLLLPERQIGLSAHDFQQAVAAPRVILSRACRDAEAETVPSRWLNRLLNLLSGLPQQQGPEALATMRRRGYVWLDMAAALERPTPAMLSDPRLQPARRPAPQPPVAARPKRLALTRIETLIRDPYAIYARYVLKLKPLDPLHPAPDARDRGIVVHEVLARFVQNRPAMETPLEARQRLMALADDVLAVATPFPAARLLWRARLERATSHFLTEDARHGGTALAVETEGRLAVGDLGFSLFGTPDRIDRLPDGTLHLIDYKTGTPPSLAQQKVFAKQLLLAAAMAERGGFADLGKTRVSLISYVGMGAGEKAVDSPVTPEMLDAEWEKLVTLIARYLSRTTGYAARRAVFETRFPGDYDHLARHGEWQMTDRAVATPVGAETPAQEDLP